MKLTPISASAVLLTFAVGLAAMPLLTRAADDKDKKPAAPAATNTATNMPEAVFNMAASSVKDPFFPLSTRTLVVAATTNVPTQLGAKDFHLMGKSGTDDAPLVIINDHSFAPGEKAVIVPWGSQAKVAVTVLQIKDYSAIIQVDGLSAPVEISLSKDFR